MNRIPSLSFHCIFASSIHPFCCLFNSSYLCLFNSSFLLLVQFIHFVACTIHRIFTCSIHQICTCSIHRNLVCFRSSNVTKSYVFQSNVPQFSQHPFLGGFLMGSYTLDIQLIVLCFILTECYRR